MSPATRRRRTAAGVAAAAALLVTACGAPDTDRSGGPASPTVLTLASNDADLRGAPAVEHFAAAVARRSGGRLTVRVAFAWGGGEGDEARLIRDVAAGKAELGWSGTRAFDLAGVTSLRPLHVPFLVHSREAQGAVIRDDDVTAALTRGLEPAGLTGLALAADSPRIMAAKVRPVLSPSQLRGLTVGTSPSRVQAEGLEALGATPVALPSASISRAGKVPVLETSWTSYLVNGLYEPLPFVTADLTLWPRTVAVFGSARRLADLSEREQGWLRAAGADTQAWSTTPAANQDAAKLAQACRLGARVALAGPDRLEEWRRAVRPMAERLARDPGDGHLLRRLQAVVAAAPKAPAPVVPAGCAYQPGDEQAVAPDPGPLTAAGRPGALPPGTYRHRVTAETLRAAGVDDVTVRGSAGVWTWTLGGGRWEFDIKPDDPDPARNVGGFHCEGWYDVDGDAAAFTTTFVPPEGGDCAPATWTARWTASQRSLTWSPPSVSDFAPFFAPTAWTRIG